MADQPSGGKPTAEEQFGAEAARKAERRENAQREEDRGIWFSLGLFGIVGWSVTVPTLIGVGLGVMIDRSWPGRMSWTLTLLFVGIVIGCLNAWYWINHEGRDR